MQSAAPMYPQPKTPLRGQGLIAFDFIDVGLARRGAFCAKPELKKLFAKRIKSTRGRKFFVLKPKKNSLGILWRGQAFYWSPKGYYRPGKDRDGSTPRKRKPLHHQIWESLGKAIPAMHEVIFLNDDEHDFRPKNLKCMHKSDVHRRIIDLKGPTMNKWQRSADSRLSHLLNRAQSKERANDSTIKFLGERRKQFHPQA